MHWGRRWWDRMRRRRLITRTSSIYHHTDKGWQLQCVGTWSEYLACLSVVANE